MSLSSHLNPKSSPVRAWFEQHLPETQSVAREANRRLRGDASECSVRRIDGADPSLVGTAVDYLLRACLRVTSIERTVASEAAQALAADPRIGMKAIEIEREAVTDIKSLRPGRRDLTKDEWLDLCVRCLVLARFEQYYRAGLAVRGLVVGPLRRCSGLDEFAQMSLPRGRGTIRDLARLGRTAWEDHRDLRQARPLVLNPRFRLSRALGGADADLIARHRLVDWKASAATRVVGRHELWQLAGYALADSTDKYEIREVGIAALRWRSEVSWPLTDLLEELAPGPPVGLRVLGDGAPRREPIDLAALRGDFARVAAGDLGESAQRVDQPHLLNRGRVDVEQTRAADEDREAPSA